MAGDWLAKRDEFGDRQVIQAARLFRTSAQESTHSRSSNGTHPRGRPGWGMRNK